MHRELFEETGIQVKFISKIETGSEQPIEAPQLDIR